MRHLVESLHVQAGLSRLTGQAAVKVAAGKLEGLRTSLEDPAAGRRSQQRAELHALGSRVRSARSLVPCMHAASHQFHGDTFDLVRHDRQRSETLTPMINPPGSFIEAKQTDRFPTYAVAVLIMSAVFLSFAEWSVCLLLRSKCIRRPSLLSPACQALSAMMQQGSF